MKTLFLFLIAVCAVSAFGQTTAVTEAEVFTDPQYPFSITVSKGWKKTADPAGRMRISAKSENGLGSTNFNINVVELDGAEKISSAAFVKMMTVDDPQYFERTTKKLLPGSKITSSGKGVLGGREALYVVFAGDFTGEDFTLPVKFYVTQMYFEGTLYTITFTTVQADFDKYYPIFKEIAASFKLVPAAAVKNSDR